MNKLNAVARRRLSAIKNNELIFIGSVCAKCGHSKRYTSNKKCYTCAKIKAREKAKLTMKQKELGVCAFIDLHKNKPQYSAWI